MSRDYRKFKDGEIYGAVQYIERGHSVSETADLVGVTTSRIRSWWSRVHPQLPIRNPGPDTKFLRLVNRIERKLVLDVYECPYCLGLIYQPVIVAPKPWHCPWCGREVK